MNEGTLYITREIEFSAAHRLYVDELSTEENYDVFGKCANPYGHGHNYLLQVTISGESSPKSQMIVHFAKLKMMLEELIVTPLDHRHLNLDVPFLKGILPTSENIIQVLWNRLDEAFQGQSFQLTKLRLSSSSRNWVEYFGPKR